VSIPFCLSVSGLEVPHRDEHDADGNRHPDCHHDDEWLWPQTEPAQPRSTRRSGWPESQTVKRQDRPWVPSRNGEEPYRGRADHRGQIAPSQYGTGGEPARVPA
jgi:hypothetical protein